MAALDDIINVVGNNGYFSKIKRYSLNWDVEKMLHVILNIGQLRSDRFVIDSENRFAYENILRWCIGDSEMKAIHPVTKAPIKGSLDKGIYIAGNTCSGKSWCMEIVSSFVSAAGIGISYDGGDDSLEKMRFCITRADDIVSEYLKHGNIDNLKKAPMITIQDLGQEQHECVYMGNRVNVLKNLIEYRGDFANKITMFTSNYPINNEQLCDIYGDRVASRLIGMCNYFEIKGKDRRQL